MIVTESTLEGIFDQIPAIRLSDIVGAKKPKFSYGDRLELIKFLMTKGDESYPLIWLLTSPNSPHEKHYNSGHQCSRQCEFILATRETTKDMLSNERFNSSFKYVLNPLQDYVIQGITAANETRLLEDVYYSGRYFDISVAENAEESEYIDLWDAIKIKADIEFIYVKDNCKNTIKWITPKILSQN